MTDITEAAHPKGTGRLFVYNGGFLNARVRRILSLAGWRLTTGRPGPEDQVGVWGHSPTAHRGEAMAARSGAGLVRVEDAFLRSIKTGRDGESPIGLLIDPYGVHFDSAKPGALERILSTHPLDDTALLDAARGGIARLQTEGISKYNTFDPDLQPPDPGYVLVVDQTAGDASIAYGGASAATFREMLAFAQIEHPGARILVKTHPETQAGHRPGHFGTEIEDSRTRLYSAPVSPWRLLEGAAAVYTVSSQLGFEAILAGHKPRVFGQPFYGGWGLTLDETPVPRRERRLTRAQLFSAAMILAPTWYDPCRDRLCDLDTVLSHLAACARSYREDQAGYTAVGMRMWKRHSLQGFFGRERRLRFEENPDRATAHAVRSQHPILAWAGRVPDTLEPATATSHVPLIRLEDGFLRSRGLGADLVPPLSLVADDLGIYYNPRRESRLERLIAHAAELPPPALERAERLMRFLQAHRVTKYNVGASSPALPEGHRILVPGQVEDDASIRLGCGKIATNRGLLQATREANPDAVVIYKPHPDVEAGLRPGSVPDASAFADLILSGVDAAAALAEVHEVWTLTSALGFEALLRGLRVACLGTPFYAGWGLTHDRGHVPARREARPSLTALVHATLIAYPRYRDPISGLPCPVEVVAERLAEGRALKGGLPLRLLSKAQGLLASHSGLWR